MARSRIHFYFRIFIICFLAFFYNFISIFAQYIHFSDETSLLGIQRKVKESPKNAVLPKKSIISSKDLKDNEVFESIKASLKNKKIYLSWNYTEKFKKLKDNKIYRVVLYRFKKPPTLAKQFDGGMHLKTIDISFKQNSVSKQIGENYFYDKLKKSGIYYYVISISKKAGERYFENLIEGVNLVSSVQFIPPMHKIFRSMKVTLEKGRDTIKVFWQYDKIFKKSHQVNKYKIELHRFNKIPRSLNDLSANSLIITLSANKMSYSDSLTKSGIYYYSIFLKRGQEKYPKSFTQGVNLVVNINFQLESSFLSFKNFKKILRLYYYQEDYKNTIKKLKRYLQAPENKIRAIALFYTGLSLFKENNFKESITYFSHPLVVQYDENRALFWQRMVNKYNKAGVNN